MDKMGYDIDKAPIYPASYGLENVIIVANMDRSGFLHSSSNYGIKSVDLAAPGTRILFRKNARGKLYTIYAIVRKGNQVVRVVRTK